MWKKLKYFNKTNSNNSISTDQWFEHFQNLLTEDNKSSGSALREEINLTLSDPTEVVSDILDNPISNKKIIKALNQMKTGKSGGEDGLVIEMFKTTIDILLPWLCLLFNKILISSKFPDSWSRAVIYPIYKKGDVTNPCNYRGISLLNVMGKIFTKVINNRLIIWGDIENKFKEQQAGYRQGYATVDNCFSLYAVVQKYLTKTKGRSYCIFVDFSSAFDLVHHPSLLYTLIKNKVSSKIVKLLKSMYENMKSCVLANNGLSISDAQLAQNKVACSVLFYLLCT
ncbi:hypothetical protein SNE40_020036 [Patella caerulea]|uniref:Reverse transcriptase domain-containing protein n=1 Tax=Patella caerulea TaxID=87958 RepID=A0AAN8GDP9_PATCE